jgi:membrane protease YdiL (CAAX protease family)
MLAEKPWKLDAVALLFLGVIATFCLGMVLFSPSMPSAENVAPTRSDFWQIVLSASFLQIPALLGIGLFFRLHKVSWKEAFGLRMRGCARAMLCGFLAAGIFLPVAWGYQMLSINLMDLAGMKPQSQLAVEELQDPNLTTTDKMVLGVIVVVLAPLVEEALFRGILYPAIKQLGYPRLALWSSSAFFAVMHFNMATFVPLMFLALVLVYLYETFQGLFAPVAAHAFFNAVNFFALIFADQIDQAWDQLIRALHLT